jgi:hypothetical protein
MRFSVVLFPLGANVKKLLRERIQNQKWILTSH